jgi:hypothetical protein
MILLYEEQSVTVQSLHTCVLKDTCNNGIQIAGRSFLLNVACEKQVVCSPICSVEWSPGSTTRRLVCHHISQKTVVSVTWSAVISVHSMFKLWNFLCECYCNGMQDLQPFSLKCCWCTRMKHTSHWMGFWISITSTHGLIKYTLISRNIQTAVYNKCLSENNWQSPLMSLWASTLTVRGLLSQFLSKQLLQLLDDVRLAMWQKMWVLHNGAPAHSSCNVMWYLDSHCPWEWIGLPWSHDLTTSDFYFCGHLNKIVHPHWCNMQDKLWNAFEVAGMATCNMPDIF